HPPRLGAAHRRMAGRRAPRARVAVPGASSVVPTEGAPVARADHGGAMTDELTTAEARDVGPLGFARMSGLSIAGRDAAPWATDFLNAAYYRRPADERAVDDLRAAFCVLTTYWYRKSSGRRLHAADLRAFHRAYGRERFATGESARGTLSRAQLMSGAAELLGDWFPDAYADDARRAWGI